MMTQAVLYQDETKSQRKRRKQMAPSGDSVTPLHLTLRDVAVLQDLSTARYMTVLQIRALHWRDSKGGEPIALLKACQRRLRQLFDHGLVRRIEPLVRYSEGKKPLIYALDKRGAHILSNEVGIDPAEIDYKPQTTVESNYPFLQHILDTNELRIAFTEAAAAAGIQLEYWRNERELKSEADVILLTDPEGKTHKAAVVPDALVYLNRNGKRALFMLEIDRRTVTVDPSKWQTRGWSRKVRTYAVYFGTKAYKQRYGDYVAQVLVITTGEQRLAHLKEVTEQAGGGQRFWFTTFTQATAPTQLLTTPIWEKATAEGLHTLLD